MNARSVIRRQTLTSHIYTKLYFSAIKLHLSVLQLGKYRTKKAKSKQPLICHFLQWLTNFTKQAFSHAEQVVCNNFLHNSDLFFPKKKQLPKYHH